MRSRLTREELLEGLVNLLDLLVLLFINDTVIINNGLSQYESDRLPDKNYISMTILHYPNYY